MSTICPYSNYYNDLFRDMAAEFGKKGVIFVGVNSGTLETVEEVQAHAREHGHTFDIIKDPDGKIAELLDARRTPEVFLFDATGTASLPRPRRLEALLAGPEVRDRGACSRPAHPCPPRRRRSAARFGAVGGYRAPHVLSSVSARSATGPAR